VPLRERKTHVKPLRRQENNYEHEKSNQTNRIKKPSGPPAHLCPNQGTRTRDAVENYHLPIELMMENAGLHLARLVTTVVHPGSTVNIGIGNGNNGGRPGDSFAGV